MTLRLADIGARIAGVEQLGAVVKAMRGIAAARAQQARNQVAAVNSYAGTIAAAIGRALALMPATSGYPQAVPGRQALVIFAAEQGFAGAFSQHVFAAIGADLSGSLLFLVGTRAATVIAENGIEPAWHGAMPSHSAGIPKLADQISDALYTGIAKGEIGRLDVVFCQHDPGRAVEIRRIALFPLDLAHYPRPISGSTPLHNLAAADLLAGLAADYLHARLCHAALHAFAAENEARMEAMAAARDQVEQQLCGLRSQERLIRQEEITAEVIELAGGASASLAEATA